MTPSFNIPIFITARGNDEDNFKINKEALKFSYIYIKNLNLFTQTYIISDNKELLEYAKKLGFINTIHYPCGSNKDIKYLEYFATYRYATENNFRPDWFILLNINQLFKNTKLLVDCINNIDYKYDVITSYTVISDRSHFFVDDNHELINKDKHLLSSVHNRVNMGDAAIYAIQSKFAFECMEYDDPAEHFWNGKIKYIQNKSLFTNIYKIEDIYQYYDIGEIINEVKKIQD